MSESKNQGEDVRRLTVALDRSTHGLVRVAAAQADMSMQRFAVKCLTECAKRQAEAAKAQQ